MGKLLEGFERKIQMFPMEVDAAIVDASQDERILASLQKEPGKVKYPIEWTSERQRRAFFATDGFGKGIPYQRTGKLAKSWRLVPVGGQRRSIRITNTSKISKYVYGKARSVSPQQQFHRNTGWFTFKDKREEVIKELRFTLRVNLLRRLKGR